MNQEELKRLVNKSDRQVFINDLITGFGLSKVEAEALYDRITLLSFTRLFIKAPSGRKRFNVLGALNGVTHELTTVTNDTYINAQSFCDLLWRIACLNLGVPITLVLDNARYQKCKIVLELAKSLNIELLYLPPYSPNLNLIERLWKFVKKQCLYSKYYAEFKDFKNAITDCLNRTDTTHKQELDSLLTLRVSEV